MIRLWLTTFIFAILPLVAAAQQVTVRSGDHEDFTRLVFNLPSRIEWSIKNTQTQAELRFGRQGLSFDISSVFERIQGKRLADLVVGNDGQKVILRLACDCVATGFWFRRSMLVVDISDASTDVSGRLANDRMPDRVPEIQLPQRGRSVATVLVQEAFALGTSEIQTDTVASDSEHVRRDAELRQSRDRLLRQFSRATSQGLLKPKSTMPTGTRKGPDKEDEVEAPSKTAAAEPVSETRDPASNLHINVRTSIDRDFLDTLEANDGTSLAGRCIEADLLDVASWGDDTPFWQQVGPLRARMTSEFDRMEERSVRELAELYLYFGFGREAQELIAMLPQDQERTLIYAALAKIMDAGHDDSPILENQLDCEAPTSMWSALSNKELPKQSRLDKDAILRAFSALPRHLRTHLGPVLSARLLAAGHSRESAAILRVLDRVEETRTPAADMVLADLELENGKPEAAEKVLETVVESNGVLSPDAVARQIDSQFARGGDVSVELAQLASAYAFEHAGSPLGAKLARAHILALGASGAFDEAFAELDRLEAQADVSYPQVRAALTSRLSTHAAQIELLRHVLAGAAASPDQLSQETALSLAEQLLDAGFHDQSSKMLAQTFHGRNGRRARLIRAESALELGRPRQAEVELLGLDGQDVNILRARARSMVGEHQQAYDLFKAAGLGKEAAREAWLADNRAAEISPAVSGADPEPDPAAEDQGILARNRALLENAGATRDTLEALLAEAPAPAVEN